VRELTLQRGVEVSDETIRAWCERFGQQYPNRLRRRGARPGHTWHLDEVFVEDQRRTAVAVARGRPARRVLLLAPTGKAVDVAVREGAGDVGYTVAKALKSLGDETLDRRTVVVVDKAGMAGTDNLRQLLTATTNAGVKTVLVGDAHQLAPVKARGSMFAQLCSDLPWTQRLSEVWRMRDPQERSASLALRDDGPAPLRRAVEWYPGHDQLHTGDPIAMAHDVLGRLSRRYRRRQGRAFGMQHNRNGRRAQPAHPRRHHRRRRAHRHRRPQAPHRGRGSDHQPPQRPHPRSLRRHRHQQTRQRSGAQRQPLARLRRRHRTSPASPPAASTTAPAPTSAATTYASTSPTATRSPCTPPRASPPTTTHAVLGESTSRALLYVALTRGRESNAAYLYERTAGGDRARAGPT
jgi:hypothetical protein